MSDYSELKKRAMDATPGPWYEQDDEDSAAGAVFIMPTSDVWAPPICRITTEANAAYVAAANPSVILQLIEDNERLGLELKDFQWGASVEAEAGDEARTEVSKLRAEIAGLKTGYQAYERVNSELKAELKKIDSDRKACWAEFKVQGRRLDELKAENEALCKRIDDLSPFKGAPMKGPDTKCLACDGYHSGLGGLPCPKMNAVAQALSMDNQRITPVEPLRVPHPLEAALGKGEQS